MESFNTDIANDSMTSEQCEERIESIDEIYRTYNASRKMQIGRTSSGTLTLKSSQNDDVEGNEGNNINKNTDQDETTIESTSTSKQVGYDEIESDRDNKICVAMASKPYTYNEMEDGKSRQVAKLPSNRIVSGQVTKRLQSGPSSSCTTTYSNANTMQYCSSSEFRQSKNSVRFADENCSPEESMMRMMSAQDYYAQQIAMSSGGYNIYGNYPQARAGPGSGGYQYPIDQAEMFNRCQYMNIPSQSDSAGGCNGRYQYHHQPPVTLQHHHERKESGESSSCQHNPQDICSEACTAQSGDYTSQSCAGISKSSLNLCNNTSNDAGNDICNSLQDDCPDRSDKPSCQSRCSFPKMNSMHNSYSAQDYMESLGCTFCEQSASNMDPSSGSYPSEYCYGAPIPIEHCAQSSPMTYDTQQMARPCHSAPYCWPMQSGCAPTPTYCPMSCCAPSPVSCMPPCCCPQQSSCNCAKDSVDIQTIYGTDYRGICGNQFNHFPNTGSCGICSNCSACMGIVSGPNDDCPETCAPCKGSCIFTGTNGFCSMAHPTSSYHQMMCMSTGSSHQMTHGSSHDISTGSSYQISPGSSYQISPGSSHQIVPVRSQQISPSMSQGSSHQMQLAMSPSSSHQMQLCMCPSSLQQAMAPTSSHQMQLGMPSFSTHEMSPMMSRMMSPMSSNCSFQMPPCQIRSCPGLPQIVPSMSPNLSPTHSFQMPCTSSTCAQNFANPLPGSASSGIPLPFSQSWSAQPYEMPEDGGYMPAQPFSNPTPKASSYDVRTMNKQCP